MYLKNEEVRKEVVATCLLYGLMFKETETGLLISNQAGEYFLLRLKKGGSGVRRILHENHGKGFKKGKFNPEQFTREDVAELFHPQEVYDMQGKKETDVKRVLAYIHWHGMKRAKLDGYRRRTVKALLA